MKNVYPGLCELRIKFKRFHFNLIIYVVKRHKDEEHASKPEINLLKQNKHKKKYRALG